MEYEYLCWGFSTWRIVQVYAEIVTAIQSEISKQNKKVSLRTSDLLLFDLIFWFRRCVFFLLYSWCRSPMYFVRRWRQLCSLDDFEIPFWLLRKTDGPQPSTDLHAMFVLEQAVCTWYSSFGCMKVIEIQGELVYCTSSSQKKELLDVRTFFLGHSTSF